MANSARLRVLALHTHPVQYLAPMYERYAADPSVDLLVAYWSLLESAGDVDPGFGGRVDWGLPLLDGYKHVVLTEPSQARFLRGLHKVWRLIRTGQFDVVVSYGYNFPAAWVSFVGAKVTRTPWVFLGDNHVLAPRSGRPRPGKRTLLRLLGYAVDGIFAGSVRSQRFYRQFAGTKVHLVPHAIDDERFARDAGAAGAEVPTRNAGDVVLLFVGKLVANKRIDDVIRALDASPKAVLWIVGTGPEKDRLTELAEPLGDRVHFLGFRDQTELPSIFSQADVVVLPSAHETFGLAVSEGASLGCTAIVSDACGVVDSVVVSEVSGLVTPVGDVEALRIAIARVSDQEVLSSLKAGMRRVRRAWTAAANAKNFSAACAAVARR